MRKETGWTPAPYVGRPFVYTWKVGVDEMGRFVAGEDVQLRHTMPEWEYLAMGGGARG